MSDTNFDTDFDQDEQGTLRDSIPVEHLEARLRLTRSTLASLLKAVARRHPEAASDVHVVDKWFRGEARRVVHDTAGTIGTPRGTHRVDGMALAEAEGVSVEEVDRAVAELEARAAARREAWGK